MADTSNHEHVVDSVRPGLAAAGGVVLKEHCACGAEREIADDGQRAEWIGGNA